MCQIISTGRKLNIYICISKRRIKSIQYCNDKTIERVDVMIMFIDKLEGAAYRHPR